VRRRWTVPQVARQPQRLGRGCHVLVSGLAVAGGAVPAAAAQVARRSAVASPSSGGCALNSAPCAARSPPFAACGTYAAHAVIYADVRGIEILQGLHGSRTALLAAAAPCPPAPAVLPRLHGPKQRRTWRWTPSTPRTKPPQKFRSPRAPIMEHSRVGHSRAGQLGALGGPDRPDRPAGSSRRRCPCRRSAGRPARPPGGPGR
jgi:hypothetical protein